MYLKLPLLWHAAIRVEGGAQHSRLTGTFAVGSGITGDVIHFNATQAVLMGPQYWGACHRAMTLNTVVPSAKTAACKKD